MWTLLNAASVLLGVLPLFLVRILWRMLDIFDGRVGAALRYALIKRKLGSCGDRVYFGAFIIVDDFSKLQLGSGISIHNGVTILSKGGVYIGDNVAVAHGSSIISGNHTWADPSVAIKHNPVELAHVYIHEDVWVGAGARVLAGVTIKTRSVIAAGAIVNKDVESCAVYGGVPARRLRVIN